jgi:hypothetical protein
MEPAPVLGERRRPVGVAPQSGAQYPKVPDEAQQELTMKCLAFAIGLLALGFVASTPARADFAVIQFGGGHCEIWWDSSDKPWGDTWKKDRDRLARLVRGFDRAR